MVDKSVVIEAKEVQDSGLEVVGGHDILDRAVTDFVGGSVGHAALDSAAGEPDREALAVVVATGGGIGITLADRQPADLAAPVDERRVQQPALLQVLTSAAAGLSVRRQMPASALDAGVGVPRLAAKEELDEPHAAFHQPAGDQAARAVLAGCVLV